MTRRNALISSLAMSVSLALAVPSIASASQTIGQTGVGATCGDDEAYVQRSVTSGNGYTSATDGVITSWSAWAARRRPMQHGLSPRRLDALQALQKDRRMVSANTLNTFTGVRLPIAAGQEIGVYLPPGSAASCEFSANPGDVVDWSLPLGEPPLNTSYGYPGSDTGWRVNAQAVVEPDADHDGFGDETKDQCPTNAATQGPCPITPVKKKCKKQKRKHHSAAVAKKKCKKKHH